MQLFTQRLILTAASQAMAAREFAFLTDDNARGAFERIVGAQVKEWPPLYNDIATCSYFLEKLTNDPKTQGWWTWYILLLQEQSTPLLAGTAGFHGPPDIDGSVEIGYSVLAEQQRQGIASETVKALTAWAFSHSQVTRVIITTLDQPEFVPSSKVALKCGFSYTGTEPSDEGTLLVYELKRQDFGG